MRVLDGDTEEPRPDSDALVGDLPFAEGDVFSRSRIIEGLEQVRDHVERAAGAGVAVTPATRIRGDVVDLDLVVVE